ncbi:response regulator [Achromobacter spanius]|uniref:response regulator n=1 Tax=Achromobacter spanius TaxID=217203 RepID=UPI0038099B99
MRVLIVDDDRTTAELTGECLTMEPGVSVQLAFDGAEALQSVVQFRPHTVLLDVQLPDASGVELAPRLKAACTGSALRIVIFSGSSDDPSPLPAGVDAWLSKPAHLDKLLDCIFCARERQCGVRDSSA